MCQIYTRKTQLSKILLKHLQKITKVFGKKIQWVLGSLHCKDLEKEKRWLGRLEARKKNGYQELFWEFLLALMDR